MLHTTPDQSADGTAFWALKDELMELAIMVCMKKCRVWHTGTSVHTIQLLACLGPMFATTHLAVATKWVYYLFVLCVVVSTPIIAHVLPQQNLAIDLEYNRPQSLSTYVDGMLLHDDASESSDA